MFCPKCGTNTTNSNFCPKCGNPTNLHRPSKTPPKPLLFGGLAAIIIIAIIIATPPTNTPPAPPNIAASPAYLSNSQTANPPPPTTPPTNHEPAIRQAIQNFNTDFSGVSREINVWLTNATTAVAPDFGGLRKHFASNTAFQDIAQLERDFNAEFRNIQRQNELGGLLIDGALDKLSNRVPILGGVLSQIARYAVDDFFSDVDSQIRDNVYGFVFYPVQISIEGDLARVFLAKTPEWANIDLSDWENIDLFEVAATGDLQANELLALFTQAEMQRQPNGEWLFSSFRLGLQ